MTDRAINATAWEVRALLAGTKTQMRRILKPQPGWVADGVMYWRGTAAMIAAHRLPYAVGDRLWVREPWRKEARFDHLPPRALQPGSLVSYEADYDGAPNDGCRGRLRPGMFMPRWASRLTLTVTEVRVQRLQDISTGDADAEGFGGDFPERVMPEVFPLRDGNGWGDLSIRDCYGHLWEHINGPGAWEANPWVAAYTFTVEPRNIDALTAEAA